jgi:hypothetical protein
LIEVSAPMKKEEDGDHHTHNRLWVSNQRQAPKGKATCQSTAHRRLVFPAQEQEYPEKEECGSGRMSVAVERQPVEDRKQCHHGSRPKGQSPPQEPPPHQVGQPYHRSGQDRVQKERRTGPTDEEENRQDGRESRGIPGVEITVVGLEPMAPQELNRRVWTEPRSELRGHQARLDQDAPSVRPHGNGLEMGEHPDEVPPEQQDDEEIPPL